MRKIKFRAWIPSEKVMIHHREVIERTHRLFEDNFENTDIIMQFTGLKDKNGVEIWEGDVLRITEEPNPFNEGTFKAEIVFIDGCFCYKQHRSNGKTSTRHLYLLIDNTSIANYEVVGNIYEHKHLLEEL